MATGEVATGEVAKGDAAREIGVDEGKMGLDSKDVARLGTGRHVKEKRLRKGETGFGMEEEEVDDVDGGDGSGESLRRFRFVDFL